MLRNYSDGRLNSLKFVDTEVEKKLASTRSVREHLKRSVYSTGTGDYEKIESTKIYVSRIIK